MPAPTERQGFPPVLPARPRLLILGSMPGLASLAAGQYYGHPRNRFWPLLARLLNTPLPASYAARETMLKRHGIALWDVLAECRREGSLDAAIERASERPNPVPELLARQPGIRAIGFNGRAAAQSFARHHPPLTIPQLSLPSTSPANAAWSLERLAGAWRPLLEAAGMEPR